MKWGVGIVVVIVAGALYYFWQQSHFNAKGDTQDTQIQAHVQTEAKTEPEKYIPPNAVMEDGTI